MINWPEKYNPDRASVHARNEIDIQAAPEAAWAWLVRAKDWPSWYSNSHDVAIEGGASDLQAGSRFRWKTFGASLNSRVEEFSPNQKIAWSARGMGIDAYHVFLIEARANGCHVLTEETENGWLASLSNTLRPRNISDKHQMWLEGLRAKAQGGPPPG
ncbi:MAG: SRPBCC domain-containing protein [Nitrososphaerales archaeon]